MSIEDQGQALLNIDGNNTWAYKVPISIEAPDKAKLNG